MIRLAISPCPNDTYAFFALLTGKVAYEEEIQAVFEDIEALNHRCIMGDFDICKISFATYVREKQRLRLLENGSALGFGCGPLIVAKKDITVDDLTEKRIAIPGEGTTATLLLKILLGGRGNFVEMRFDEIMPAVTAGKVDAGLIIHESRFTYSAHGLKKIIDLGDWWEKETDGPIPLGGIVARADLDPNRVASFDHALSQSIAYADANPDEVVPYMRRYAQEMDPEVMKGHVELYVNRFTRGLGEAGRKAVETLAEKGASTKASAPTE